MGDTVHNLTEREKQVLALVAQGCTDKEIAAQLRLSFWTVRNYVATAAEKLGVQGRHRAALAAFRQGKLS